IADGAGFSVSQAGDINADGVDDLVIGGPFAHATTGLSYVVFGTTDQQPNPFPLTGLNGINGFFINGEQPGDYAGFSVSGGGDINGDGIDDFMLGTRSISEIGKAYVVFGNNTGFPSTLNLADINGSNGLVILGESAGDFLGKSVSSAGDVNGDGVNDLILGAERANPNGNTYAGTSYVMFGSNSVTTSPFNLADLDGSNGFVMNGGVANSSSGASVDFAGDFNADGVGDIIVGAPIFNSSTGQSYVIYGNDVIFKDGFQ
ncbi:MAG: integrin alpha, partial [Marinicella sp.]